MYSNTILSMPAVFTVSKTQGIENVCIKNIYCLQQLLQTKRIYVRARKGIILILLIILHMIVDRKIIESSLKKLFTINPKNGRTRIEFLKPFNFHATLLLKLIYIF